MTPDAFAAALSRLVGLRFPPSTLDTHYAAAGDVDPELLDGAIRLAVRECSQFPAPAELLALVDRVRLRRAPAVAPDRSEPLARPTVLEIPTRDIGGSVGVLRVPVTRLWRYQCEACSDTGWTSFWCGSAVSPRYPDLEVRRCGEVRHGHADHEYVRPCPCAATNDDVQRKRQTTALHAASREASTKGGRSWRA